MGSILAGPPALQRAHSGHGHSATARRGGRAGGGGREEEKEACQKAVAGNFIPAETYFSLTSLQVEMVDLVPSSIMHSIAALIQISSPRGGKGGVAVNLGKYSVGAAEVVYFQ